ncbi:MAG: VOC family protein [Candidatus Eremiobacterota bacterium]
MRIQLASVFVEDQEKALDFYTRVVGFRKKQDIPLGEARWLTVVSPHDPDGTELLLEPCSLPAARTFQKALFEAGIPFTAFPVGDIQREYARMTALGVRFTLPPSASGNTTLAQFEDTCGNLIQLFQG